MQDIKKVAKLKGPVNRDAVFLKYVGIEAKRARDKFPAPNKNLAALVEEVGELAKALLEESDERVYEEAVQVATMALRIATEGDPSLRNPDVVRHGLVVIEDSIYDDLMNGPFSIVRFAGSFNEGEETFNKLVLDSELFDEVRGGEEIPTYSIQSLVIGDGVKWEVQRV